MYKKLSTIHWTGFFVFALLAALPFIAACTLEANIETLRNEVVKPPSVTKHTVTFHTGGGTPDDFTEKVVDNEPVDLPPHPTYATPGKTFGWWFIQDPPSTYDETPWDFATPVTEDIDLYASWNDDDEDGAVHTVVFFDTGKAFYTTGFYVKDDVKDGSAVTKPDETNITRAGYVFDGWYTTDDEKWVFDDDAEPDTVGESMALYARWLTTFTLEPVGEANAATSAIRITFKEAVPGLAKTDLTIGGEQSDDGVIVAGALSANSDNTVYTLVVTTVTAAGQVSIKVDHPKVVASAVPVTVVEAGGGATSFTVTFNMNGGDTEASPTPKTVTPPATTVDALPTAPTRADYTFVEWNTKQSGNGTKFIATTPVTGSITVFAQWKIDWDSLSPSGASDVDDAITDENIRYWVGGNVLASYSQDKGVASSRTHLYFVYSKTSGSINLTLPDDWTIEYDDGSPDPTMTGNVAAIDVTDEDIIRMTLNYDDGASIQTSYGLWLFPVAQFDVGGFGSSVTSSLTFTNEPTTGDGPDSVDVNKSVIRRVDNEIGQVIITPDSGIQFTVMEEGNSTPICEDETSATTHVFESKIYTVTVSAP